ncbi:hypothetical protein HPB47_014865 [Ixodes persulcatus]|uniref:Uncharacterized protein n=1 Tax=Ixodes persulcatus TaxID=34615 RepID=A0AC60QUY7_IXOPE|nr:hypothetical protein HPB47_014865 [Ixodes persulcatus]
MSSSFKPLSAFRASASGSLGLRSFSSSGTKERWCSGSDWGIRTNWVQAIRRACRTAAGRCPGHQPGCHHPVIPTGPPEETPPRSRPPAARAEATSSSDDHSEYFSIVDEEEEEEDGVDSPSRNLRPRHPSTARHLEETDWFKVNGHIDACLNRPAIREMLSSQTPTPASGKRRKSVHFQLDYGTGNEAVQLGRLISSSIVQLEVD